MLDNSIKTIPKGWKTHILKNEVQFLKGIGLSKNMVVDNGKNKCVLYGELYTKYNESIKKVVSSTNSSEGTKSKAGDVLMPGSTTTKGIDLANAVAINEDNVLLGGDIIIIRDKNKIFNNYYFAHYLTHIRKKDIERLTQGTTIIHLYPRSLENLDITLPPINEQEKIAKILSKVDEDIDRTEEIIKKTEELKKGLMQELFSEKLKVKSQKLGNLASNIYSGGTPSRSKMEYYRGDIPWVKSTEIKFNRIKKTEESITELGLKNSSAKLCPKGSVLVAMYGQGVTRGKSAILDIDATTNQAIAIIEVGKNLNNLFLFYFLQHSYDALRNVGHGSNQSNLNLNIIKNFDIPKIKYKEQEQIAEIILSVDSKIEVNKQIKNKLIQLKKGLMNDLLSGEVRVS